MSRAYLGIGGNIGDRRGNLERTIEMLKDNEKITVCKVSSIYETEPVGYEEQDRFLNIVVEIATELNPYELLDYCNHIEAELKRERLIRWGPRTIDVDILLYDDITLKEERLMIPHPRMAERAFVIVPLREIAPGISISGESIEDIANKISDDGVHRVND